MSLGAVRLSVAHGATAVLLSALAAVATAQAAEPDGTQSMDRAVGEYVERYLATFPSRATALGDHRRDRELENLTEVRLADWLEFNERTVAALEGRIGDDPSAQLDARAVLRHARRELFRHRTLRVTQTDPLFWTGIVGGMASHLLVRDDLPLDERLRALAVRVGEVPRLCRQARAALEETPPQSFAEIRATRAARQAHSSAQFFAESLAEAANGLTDDARDELHARLASVGQDAAAALRELAKFLDSAAEKAAGPDRLGDLYAESFRLGTGVDATVADVLADAERRLVVERSRTAEFCRSIWASEGIGTESSRTENENDTVRACFARIAQDRADDLDDFVDDFRRLAAEAQGFAVREGIVELPEGFRLFVDTSPAYFVGQSVGGVYPPGPFAPDGVVMLFVPSYPKDTPAAAAAAFHRDFNDHFNAMITPHETVPGHGAQIARAAHRAARTGELARELFTDGVYVEGWGTFSELLMLDAGWGGPLDRVAHLKKRLENIARLIVDIRIHTTDISEEEILRFVTQEALQDEQFAANMWQRALLTSPQLASYDLGSRPIYDLYDAERQRLGELFDPGAFVRSMTELGSVSLGAYERRFVSLRLLDSRRAMPNASAAADLETGTAHRPGSPPKILKRTAPLPGSSHGL